MIPDYRRNRFDDNDDPLGPLANLLDIMLVFAVGLIVALVAASGRGDGFLRAEADIEVERAQELPEVPQGVGTAGSGYQRVGAVYRDPDSGKLILIGDQ